MDPKEALPDEIFEMILSSVDVNDVKSVAMVSKTWHEFVHDDWFLWKSYCNKFDPSIVNEDKKKNYSWKEIFHRNFGKNGVITKWREGKFSTRDCFKKQPSDFICEFDVNTWGYLLDIVCI